MASNDEMPHALLLDPIDLGIAVLDMSSEDVDSYCATNHRRIMCQELNTDAKTIDLSDDTADDASDSIRMRPQLNTNASEPSVNPQPVDDADDFEMVDDVDDFEMVEVTDTTGPPSATTVLVHPRPQSNTNESGWAHIAHDLVDMINVLALVDNAAPRPAPTTQERQRRRSKARRVSHNVLERRRHRQNLKDTLQRTFLAREYTILTMLQIAHREAGSRGIAAPEVVEVGRRLHAAMAKYRELLPKAYRNELHSLLRWDIPRQP